MGLFISSFFIKWIVFKGYFITQKEKIGELILAEEFIRFSRNDNTITYYLKDLVKLKIISDFYLDKEGDISYSGELKMILHINKNKRILAVGIIETKEEFIEIQTIVKGYYKIANIEEYGEYSSERPLLLDYRTYEELQLLKEELGIKGLYI